MVFIDIHAESGVLTLKGIYPRLFKISFQQKNYSMSKPIFLLATLRVAMRKQFEMRKKFAANQ